MGETFYTILGVSPDAEREAIHRAYRERVKQTHPDVSDSPDASRRFKRLTTAREVLTDETKRQRYDRLGHDTYVKQHVETSVWTAASTTSESAPAEENTRAGGGPTHSGRHDGYRDDGKEASAEGEWWQSSENTQTGGRSDGSAQSGGRSVGSSRTAGRHVAGGSHSRQGATPDGGYDPSWQQAPDAYMRSATYTESATPGRTVGELLRRLGPWLIVHVVLLTSAVATGSFVLARALSSPGLSVPAALFLIVIIGLVVVLSILHLLTQAYA